MTHGQGENAGPHPEMAAAVPHRPLLPASLAPRDFPGGSPIALGIHQLILFFPAQHKAQREGEEQAEPETAGEALIKDMQYPSSPLNRQLEQEFALLIAFEGLAGTTTGPPAHSGQVGGIKLLVAAYQDHCQPTQPRHENGTARRGVVALLDAGKPGGFTGAHRAKLFGHNAFGLLPHTLIPNRQRIQSRVFPGRHSLGRSLPEILPDQFCRPFGTMQQVGETLSTRWRFVRRVQVPAQF